MILNKPVTHLRSPPEPGRMEETRSGGATGVLWGDGAEVMAPLSTPSAQVLRATTQVRKESLEGL